jgi:clan AA aspartic protease (TIGR02281 family)
MLFSRAMRRASVAVLIPATGVMLGACAHSGVRMRELSHPDFWSALAELRPGTALALATTPSQRLFARALDDMMSGRMAAADSEFGSLRSSAADSLLRAGARVAYSAVLQYEENWPALAVLPPLAPQAGAADLAGVERWAASFRTVGEKHFEFPGRAVLLPLTLSAAGTPMIPVRINGRDLHFWLDTGSSMTIISSDVAAVLNIVPLSGDTLEMVSATGRVRALPTVLARMDIGQIVVRNATAMIVNEKQMEMRETPRSEGPPEKIDGIIGFDILHRMDVEIDFNAQRVRLRDPVLRKNDDPSSRNLFWLGVPVVRALSVNGAPLHFGLDTGAQQTFGTETLFDRLDVQMSKGESRELGGLAGVASLHTAVLHRLDVLIRDRPLFLQDLLIYAPVYKTLVSLDGVFGADVLRLGVVRMDATNGVFSVNEGQREPVIRP